MKLQFHPGRDMSAALAETVAYINRARGFMPAGTPAPVVARLNELLTAATKSPAAKSFFENAGSEAWTTTPDELAKFQAAETQKWGKVIKAAGLEAE